MPREVTVSSSLKIGQAMQGTIKHFVGRREERTSVPVTLVNDGTLRIGNGNDVRQIISTIITDGEANHLVSAGAPAKEATWLSGHRRQRSAAGAGDHTLRRRRAKYAPKPTRHRVT